MFLNQRLERLGADQRPIAAENERLAREVLQMLPAAHDRMRGAQLLVLVHPHNIRRIGEPLLHLLGAEPDNDINPLHTDTSACIEHVGQHGPTGHFVQDLGQLGVHPAAHARR